MKFRSDVTDLCLLDGTCSTNTLIEDPPAPVLPMLSILRLIKQQNYVKKTA